MVRKNTSWRICPALPPQKNYLPQLTFTKRKVHEIFCRTLVVDYDDMILSVIQACESIPEPAGSRFSSSWSTVPGHELSLQLRLLFNLTSENDDNPNHSWSVVTTKQSSTSRRRRGQHPAFRQHYHDQNYRLTDPPRTFYPQRDVITQGAVRLENTIDGLSKQLTAHANSGSKSRNPRILIC